MEPVMDFLIQEEQTYPGALGCRGCGWSLLVRHLSSILGKDTVYVAPASCFSIISGPYPLLDLKANIVHTVFAAAPATATGIRAALDRQGKADTTVAILAGDGGTFDIGLQALSGAAARGENMLYIVNNNGAYMNTGVQTSTATPYGALTTTNPAGKPRWPKDLMGIVAAHHPAYAATASLAFLEDFRKKVEKAREIRGFRLIMVDGPCPPGHKIEPGQAIEIARMTVESCLFPLYELENGRYQVNYRPGGEVAVVDCLERQGRFRHLFQEGNQYLLSEIQAQVTASWERLLLQEKFSREAEAGDLL